MKSLTAKSLLILAGAVLLPAFSAQAQSTPAAYAEGDLLLGVRASGGVGNDKNYLINLGPASALRDGTSATTIDLGGDVASDLAAAFGPNWSNRSDVLWGVFGASHSINVVNADPAKTLYASKAQQVANTLGSAWVRGTTVTQGTVTNDMGQVAINGYKTNGATTNQTTANSTKGVLAPAAGLSSYSRFQPGGSLSGGVSFNRFNPTIEANFGGGAAGSVLELYRLTPSATAGQPGELVGLLTLSASGQLSFAPASPTGEAGVSNGNAVVQFQFPKFPVVETHNGNLAIKLIRSGNVSQAVTVKVSTVNGTASATDFTAIANQTVTFAANQTAATVPVTIKSTANKTGIQADRKFALALSAPTPAGVTTGANAEVVIHDASLSKIGFAAAAYNVDYTSAARAVAVTVTRPASASLAADSVNVTVDNAGVAGTILAPSEYTLSANAVFFSEGETSKSILVTIPASSPFPAAVRLKLVGSNTGTAVLTTINHTKNDKVSPKITLTAPATSPVIVGTVNVTGSLQDAFAPALAYKAFSVTLNGAVLTTTAPVRTTANATDNFAIADVALENGANTFVISATDYSGNTSTLTKTVVYNNPTLANDTKGIYNGVLVASGTPTNDNTGFVTITVSGNSTFSGKVTLGGITVPVKGFLTNSGVAKFSPTNATSFDLVDKVEFDSYLGAVSFTVDADSSANARTLTGTLSTAATGGTTLATFDAPNTPYSGGATGVPVTGAILNQTTKGVYSVALSSKTQTPSIPAATYPQGDGVGSLTVTNTGAVTLKGNLADGTVYTLAGRLTGTVPAKVALHTNLYKKAGAIATVLSFDLTQANSDVEGLDALWIRPAQPRARYYPAGWVNGIRVDATGTAQSNIVATASNFGQGADDLVGPSANGNVTITFADGALTSPVVKNLNINATLNGKVTLIPVTPVPTDHKVTFAPASGALGGFFTHSDTTKPAFKAVLLNKGANQGAFGYFLSNPPATYNGSGVSGGVSLVKQP